MSRFKVDVESQETGEPLPMLFPTVDRPKITKEEATAYAREYRRASPGVRLIVSEVTEPVVTEPVVTEPLQTAKSSESFDKRTGRMEPHAAR